MINFKDLKSELFEFSGQNVITPWDRLKKYVFQSYPVYTGPRIKSFDDLLLKGLEYKDESDMVWIVDETAVINDDFPWHYRPSSEGHSFIHEFPRVGKRSGRAVRWGDLRLVPTSGFAYDSWKNKIIASYHDTDFEIFMISFHEAEADGNFAKLKQRFPDAKHIKNVEGIGNAHKEVGNQATTEMVYVVDADADIMDHFNFDFVPPMANRGNTTYVWSARNPINGLEYGYGGVKLFPKQQLVSLGHELPDFTTGAAFYQPISDVSNITRFNKDPYRTWRSAFRETVKLASRINPNQVDTETQERLDAWCTVDNGERFGRYCIKGALEGKAYGEANKDNVEALNKINDFEWLREQFVASMKKRISADD
jgi:hypothetical protein